MPAKKGRHRAPRSPRSSGAVLVPAVLLASGGGSLAGLAGAASADHQPVRAAAAVGVTPLPVALPRATYAKDLDLVEPGAVATRAAEAAQAAAQAQAAVQAAAQARAARAVAAARASRARRVAPPAPAPAPRAEDAAAATQDQGAPTEDQREQEDTPSVRAARPAVGGLTSRYGPRWGRMHKGLDFGSAYGSSIRAVRGGTVLSAGYDGGYGNMVTIEHEDGVVTAYAHMSQILVRGGRVSAGEVIGRVGSTGHSTGPHLHFEVRVGGRQINPAPWLRAQGVDL